MPRIKRKYRKTKLLGDTAELAFSLKAIAHGFSVSKPYGDRDPYDFLLDTGQRILRIQVKSTNNPRGSGFSANTVRSRGHHRRVCYRRSEIDFIAIYVLPADCWYIIPVEQLLHHPQINLYPGLQQTSSHCYLWESFKEAWHLLE